MTQITSKNTFYWQFFNEKFFITAYQAGGPGAYIFEQFAEQLEVGAQVVVNAHDNIARAEAGLFSRRSFDDIGYFYPSVDQVNDQACVGIVEHITEMRIGQHVYLLLAVIERYVKTA